MIQIHVFNFEISRQTLKPLQVYLYTNRSNDNLQQNKYNDDTVFQ